MDRVWDSVFGDSGYSTSHELFMHSHIFTNAGCRWGVAFMPHVGYDAVFKGNQSLLCTSLLAVFSRSGDGEGQFLLKSADTLILKQPQEANLHLNHFRCFHRKSSQKHLCFFSSLLSFSPQPQPAAASPLWSLNMVYIWTPDRWLVVCVQCYVMGSCSAIELYCTPEQREEWKSFSEGLKTVTFTSEELKRNSVIRCWLIGGIETCKGLKQRWCVRDSAYRWAGGWNSSCPLKAPVDSSFRQEVCKDQ